MRRLLHPNPPLARILAESRPRLSAAIVHASVLAFVVAGCGAAQAIALPDPALFALGAAFVEQQQARAAADVFVPAPPAPGAQAHDPDAAQAFIRYRVGYAGAAGVAAPIETHAIAGLRWRRALLVHQIGDAQGGARTSLAVDWPEASTRVTFGDVAVGPASGAGEPVRIAGIGVRRASTLAADVPSLAPSPVTTALSGEMTLSADGEGRYVAALRQEAAGAALPGYVPGFAASMLPAPAPPAALALFAEGLDRPPPALPAAGATEVDYAMGTLRPIASALPSSDLGEAFAASLRVGVTQDLSLAAEAQGREGRRDAALGIAVALGSAGALRGSVGGVRNAQGDGCATSSVDYRVANGGIELAAAYARGLADAAPGADAVMAAAQTVGGRVRVMLSATDSVALASDHASLPESPPFTSTRLTFRRALAPTLAVDGIVGYVSGSPVAGPGATADGWVASLNVRWSLDAGRPASF